MYTCIPTGRKWALINGAVAHELFAKFLVQCTVHVQYVATVHVHVGRDKNTMYVLIKINNGRIMHHINSNALINQTLQYYLYFSDESFLLNKYSGLLLVMNKVLE